MPDIKNQCYACSGCQLTTAGAAGTYMTRECAYNRDRGCTSCSTACPVGRYISGPCNTTHDLQCTICATVCPAGSYRSGATCRGDTAFDALLAGCVACIKPGGCSGQKYISGVCLGTEASSNTCQFCEANKACAPGEYRGGCFNYTNTVCQPFQTCADGNYLSDESPDRDGVCQPCSVCGALSVLRPCTRYDDTVCRGFSSCSSLTPCPRLTSTNRSAYFCDYSLGASRASCGVCPPGYASDGQYCVECQRGFTCSRVGQTVCRGQCKAGVISDCDFRFGLNFARCVTSCQASYPNSRLPWRGTFVGALAVDCGTYFLCTAGYYKNFSTGGTVSCEPCDAALLPQHAQYVTDGLSVEDDASCLWECRADIAAPNASGACVLKAGRVKGVVPNAAGYWTSDQMQTEVCGMGQTSQEGATMLREECQACQPLPAGDVMRWKGRTTQCEFECNEPSDVKRGSRCVPERSCVNAEGLVVAGLDCEPQTYPWNAPGHDKTGWVVQVGAYSPGSVAQTYPLMSSLGHGIKGRHTVTAFEGAGPRTVEGQLCSSTTGWVGGRQYVFGTLCNQSFLVYLDLDKNGTGLGVLIGSGTRGWRDGFRTQALFESELYVAGTGNGTLFVLDRWNCLLREVVVWDRPGSYLTRVHTLWGNTDKLALAVPEAKCYGAGSLAWPRRFWPLLGAGNWLAFGDEDGLWQFSVATYELLAMIKEDAAGFEVDNLLSVSLVNPGDMRLWFKDGAAWSVQAQQQPCPLDTTSLYGGSCTVECRWKDNAQTQSQYVHPTSGLCTPCTVPVCGNGQELVPCAPRADAYCGKCEFYRDQACAACPSDQGETETCTQCEFTSVQVWPNTGVFYDVPGSMILQFTSSGTIVFPMDVRADILVIGGGGNGARPGGGGGGAGTVIFASDVHLRRDVLYDVTVGNAGQASTLGTDFVASAGGNGGQALYLNGGHGGGVGGPSTVFGVPGIYTSANAFANAGVGGARDYNDNYFGGEGGGAGGPGTSGRCVDSGNGLSRVTISGEVYVFSSVFGQAYTSIASNGAVAGGGTGEWCCGYNGLGTCCGSGSLGGCGASLYLNGGPGRINTGSGGGGAHLSPAGSGGSGLVLIRHRVNGSLVRETARDTRFCQCLKRSNQTYSMGGTCDVGTLRSTPPCKAGWYASGDTLKCCEPCPPYSATLYGGAVRREQCRCLDGLLRKNGVCVGEGLYEFESACAGQTACKAPANAQLLPGDGVACRWACNAGYYRDSLAGFLNQCRPCLIGLGRTRGDDDGPWSCE